MPALIITALVSALVSTQIDDYIDKPLIEKVNEQKTNYLRMFIYGAGGVILFVSAKRLNIIK